MIAPFQCARYNAPLLVVDAPTFLTTEQVRVRFAYLVTSLDHIHKGLGTICSFQMSA